MLIEYLGNGKPVRYWCQDATRLGLKTLTGRKITLCGVKPKGQVQWQRQAFYLYGAVEPATGESHFLEFSHLDSLCFQLFLDQFAAAFPEHLHLIQMDQGSFHHASTLVLPDNVIPIFQPPHSPELNPIERLWQDIKKRLCWENCHNLDELRQKLKEQLDVITPEVIASLCGWDFITSALSSSTS